MDLDLIKVFIQYSIFIISIIIAVLIHHFFLMGFRYLIFNYFGLMTFYSFQIFSQIFFFFIYIFLNLAFSIISREDIEIIEELFGKDNFYYKIIKKLLNFMKILTPKKKENRRK